MARPRKEAEQPKQHPTVEQVPPPLPVKPQIVIRAQPMVSHPQAIPVEKNTVTLLNRKTGKKTEMAIKYATNMERRYPDEFKIVD
jgi:hypothetical protein